MMPQSQPALPTNRAFVVQFRAALTGAPPCCEGRVEHLVSGQVARFHAMEELLAFMRRVLTEVQEHSGAAEGKRGNEQACKGIAEEARHSA